MDEIWVISWRYSDGSASGVLRAYDSEERAQYDMDILREDLSMKNYELDCLPVYHLNEVS